MSTSLRVLGYVGFIGLIVLCAGLSDGHNRLTDHGTSRELTLPSTASARPSTLPGYRGQDHSLEVAQAYGNLPLRFEVNEGQTVDTVKFLSRGSGYSLFLTPTESVLALGAGLNCEKTSGPAKRSGEGHLSIRSAADCGQHAGQQNTLSSTSSIRATRGKSSASGAVLRMKLLGVNHQPHAKGLEQLAGYSNYFIGSDPNKWRTNIPNFAKVKFESVYPGVDLVYYGNQRQLEYDFVVAPGADASLIQLGFIGAEHVQIDHKGDLLLRANGGEVRWRKPVIYQEIAGIKRFVDGHYRANGGTSIGFELSDFDPRYALVIDPTLVYSTYLGGSSSGEVAAAITVDSAGNAYVTGSTGSTNFPTANAYQSALASNGTSTNAFVTKLNAAGDGVIYSTYLGGSGGGPAYGDGGSGIAVDTSGNAYIAGYTYSSNFPTSTSFQSNYAGNGDAFVAKLNPTGNSLLYSTYLGGSAQDGFPKTSIAVDSSGAAVVVGNTYSADFPALNAGQPTYGGQGDCLIAKVNTSGTVAYATYFGGNDLDDCEGLALDSSGNIYLAGSSLSTDFPFTGSVGNGHGFVAKLQNSASGVIYATKLGGVSGNKGDAGAGGVAVDSAGNAYVFGSATATDLPITTTAFQRLFGGGVDDTFVMKLDSAGSNLLYCSYLGGSQGEQGIAIAIDPSGHMYVTGNTASPDFPLSNAIQQTYGGGQSDVFIAEFDPFGTTATSLVYSAFLGGTNADHAYSIAADAAGNAYIAGNTGGGFPVTPGAFQTTYGGSVNDGFVAKIGSAGSTQTPASITATNGTAQIAVVDASAPAPFSATVTNSSGTGVPNQTVTFTAPSSGASGTFAGGGNSTTATTNSSGVATAVAFTANSTPGSYTVTATVAGVANGASFSLTNVDFTLSAASSGAVQISAASSANLPLNLVTAPANAALPVDVTYSCSVQTSLTGVTCSLSPANTAAGSTSRSTTLTITSAVGGAAGSMAALPAPPTTITYLSLMFGAGLIVALSAPRQRLTPLANRPVCLFLVLLVLATGLIGCAGSRHPNGSGTGTVIVTAAAGSLSKTTTISFNVK